MAATMPSGESPHRAGGFSTLMLLVAVAVLSLVAAGTLQLGQAMSRRAAEDALLVAGNDLGEALRSYVRAGVGGAPVAVVLGPQTLDELLRDPRVPGLRRHLRQIPVDPLTGQADWGLVRDRNGRIVAVYSLSQETPIRRTGFGHPNEHFEQAARYSDWTFGVLHLLPPGSVPQPLIEPQARP